MDSAAVPDLLFLPEVLSASCTVYARDKPFLFL